VRVLAVLVLAVALSGCAAKTPTGEVPSSSPSPTHPVPKQILSQEGNNAQCTDVLKGEARVPFKVDEGYDTLEVTWHASGLGMVGYDILSPDGTKIQGVADSNPGNQPCNHLHEGGAVEVAITPGEYTAVVRNAGVLGWHLLVNEKVAGDPMAEHHH